MEQNGKKTKQRKQDAKYNQTIFFLQIDDVTSVAVVNYMTTRLTDKSVY